jgi:hypothetical protein
LERLEDRGLLNGADLLSKLPLTFEANVGQADPAVRFRRVHCESGQAGGICLPG